MRVDNPLINVDNLSIGHMDASQNATGTGFLVWQTRLSLHTCVILSEMSCSATTRASLSPAPQTEYWHLKDVALVMRAAV